MKSLYGKFTLSTLLIMLGSFFIAFLGVNTFYHQSLKMKNNDKNMQIAKQLTQYIEETEPLDLNRFLHTEAELGYKLYLVSDTGHIKQYGAAFRSDNLSEKAVSQVLNGNEYHGMRDLPKETFVTGFFSDEMANTVGTSFKHEGTTYALFLRPDIKMLFTEAHYLLSGMFVVMAIVSILAMFIVAKKLITPITELTAATKRISEEEFIYETNITRKDELGQLARSFQLMTHKLSENDQLRKEFISNVSHDFQTPLQNIKGYTALLKENITDEDRAKYTSIIEQETERLSSLTKQLLLLTSLDQLTSLQVSSYRVDQQIRQVIQRQRWNLDDKQLSLTSLLIPFTLKADAAFLDNVWENLLTNAIKYTPEGGQITIRMEEDFESLYVSFEDTGIGFGKHEKEKLFQRFYRADKARHGSIKGTGLGLSIVKQVVDLHEGSLYAVSEGSGSTFTVKLPKKL